MYTQELAVALSATRLAANLCQRVQANIDANALQKRDKSPVTVADFGSQAIIAHALKVAFPHIPLIAEEDSRALNEPGNEEILARVVAQVRQELGQSDLSVEQVSRWIDHGNATEYSDIFWTLDPIDGTKGFLRGQQYAIALALVKDGIPVCAVLGCPNMPNPDNSVGAFFTANGTVAECVQSNRPVPYPVAVSEQHDVSQSRFCESVESAHSDHSQSSAIANELGIVGASVRMDSQVKYAAVARGDAEIYMRLPTRADYVERIWDHAAGYAVLTAAGGTITDIDGAPLDFRHGSGLEKNRGILATNGPAHARLVKAIANHT